MTNTLNTDVKTPKTVLITGCSSGLGRTSAFHFAREGWQVIATMRQLSDAGELANLSNVLCLTLDVEQQTSIDNAVAAGVAHFGQIDVVINNAGFGLFGVFEATPEAKVLKQFEVNVFGVMRVCRAVLPHFRARRTGLIVNISSGAGVFTLPLLSMYSASKFALEGFSEALRFEVRDLGIGVKIIEPGGVLTTRFGERSASEAAELESIDDYQPFMMQAFGHFERLRSQRLSSEEQVAAVIFGACTDNTAQLRYVATEDIRSLVTARRESSEAEYIALMDQQFGG